MNHYVAIPVLVAVIALGVLGPSLPLAAVLGVVCFAALLVRRRFAMPRWLELVVCAVAVVGAFLLAPVLPEVGSVEPPWTTLALAGLFLASVRLYIASPWGGPMTTVAAALFGITGCGGAHSGFVYPAAAVLFTLTALIARRLDDPLSGELDRRYFKTGAVGLLIAGVVAGGFSWGLPKAHDRMLETFFEPDLSQVGFSSRFSLGSMKGVLASDAVVMRVYGSLAPHLRGIVYTRYKEGRWLPQRPRRSKRVTVPLSLGGNAVQVVYESSGVEHYFVPMGARRVGERTGELFINSMGVVTPAAHEGATVLYIEPGVRGDALQSPALPDEGDRAVPNDVRGHLQPVAERWTVGAKTVVAKLQALQKHLGEDYGYGLEFEPKPGVDPVVDFVQRKSPAHCEYFASSMVLLARSLGLYARVVGGYHLSEYNVLGDYYVVRERDAHAWVEAWVPGEGWQTFDPTPSGVVAGDVGETPLLSAVFDVLMLKVGKFGAWIGQRTLVEFLIPLLGLLLAWVVLRWLRRPKNVEEDEVRGYAQEAGAGFVELMERLKACGVERVPNEPISGFAERLEATDLPEDVVKKARGLLARYVALRYGKRGDAQALERELAAFVVELGEL